MALVDAYLARRALDYLVGFTLSPVLWRKLPGARSAGRVQSVALRLDLRPRVGDRGLPVAGILVVDRRAHHRQGRDFSGRLTSIDGKKLEKFDIANEAEAMRLKAALKGACFTVDEVESKRAVIRRPPSAPRRCSRRPRASSAFPRATMQFAQRLYEGVDLGGESVGLITYMRTDGVQIAPEAIGACRHVIEKLFGEPYLPSSPRHYTTKAKNAQEAHEAIRPTDFAVAELRRPQLDADAAALRSRLEAHHGEPDGKCRA